MMIYQPRWSELYPYQPDDDIHCFVRKIINLYEQEQGKSSDNDDDDDDDVIA